MRVWYLPLHRQTRETNIHKTMMRKDVQREDDETSQGVNGNFFGGWTNFQTNNWMVVRCDIYMYIYYLYIYIYI